MGWGSQCPFHARVPLLYFPQCEYSYDIEVGSSSFFPLWFCLAASYYLILKFPYIIQMAYELHGLLAGNVSIVTGENIKPSYGGDDEAFLRKVITPIYRVIERVCHCQSSTCVQSFSCYLSPRFEVDFCYSCRKPKWGKMEKLLTQLGAIMTI